VGVRKVLTRAASIAAAAAVCSAFMAGTGSAAPAPNLIKNGNAERGAGSADGSTVPVPKWTITTGTGFTAVQYGAPNFLQSSDPGPANRGKNFFSGGPSDAQSVATQTVSLSAYAGLISSGAAKYNASAWLGGYATQNDNAMVEIDFKHGSSLVGSSIILGPVMASDRGNVTALVKRSAHGKVPKTATSAYVQLIMSRTDGSYNDGYADDLSLKIH